MKPDTWMPLYVGDYLGGTARLTTEQHGAYLLIIMDYWLNGPPPDDDAVLANIARLPVAQWKKHRAAIARFFDTQDGIWHHGRIEAELCRAQANVEQRAAAGRASAAKRKQQREGNDRSTGVERAIQRNGKPSPSPSTTQKYSSDNDDVQVKGTRSSPSPDPVTARALELAILLRKAGASLQHNDPNVRQWAADGVTDAQALQALDIAQDNRAKHRSTQPVTAGYLTPIIDEVRGGNARASPGARSQYDRRGQERADTIAGLTGRSNQPAQGGHHERTIDGEAERVD